MSSLLIDVGNTRTRALIWPTSGEPHPLVDEPTPGDDARCQALAAEVATTSAATAAIAITSVVPRVTEAFMAAMPGAQAVDHTWAFPFRHTLEHAESVGADRWCNVAAAVAAGLKDAIIVDAGTATTIDVLIDGVFVGGLIAPGMAFAAQKLQETGARLWPVPFQQMPLRPGRHTDEALAIGAYHVGVHGIVGTVTALAEHHPRTTVIATGGLAHHLGHVRWRVEPLWTFAGLAALLDAR